MDATNFTLKQCHKSILRLHAKYQVDYLIASKLARCAFYGCCLLSFYFAVTFWATFGSSEASKYAFAAMALVLVATKFICLPFLQTLAEQKQYLKACGCLCIYIILAFVSVLSTMGKLQSDAKHNQNNITTNITQYQQMTQSIISQQHAIKLLLESVQRDVRRDLRTRGQYILEKVFSEAQHKLSQEKSKLNPLKLHCISTSPFLELVRVLLNEERLDEARWSIYLDFILGLLLDICAFFLLLISRNSVGYKNIVKTEPPASAVATVKENDRVFEQNKSIPVQNSILEPIEMEKASGTIKVVIEPQDLYEDIKALVQSNACRPVIREIKKLAQIGTAKATQFLRQMVIEGVLNRHNNRYVLIEN